ncbi:hypothetical protein [Micromonospora sp. WMMD737]|uniref:hypothetical protein n=1 Tax=Micromonospora sp. WMMD737 TaxID=3404113 RepID=UPI003B94FA00
MPASQASRQKQGAIEGAPCPIKDAHRRLMDCHVHWHMTAEKYMDPEGFRLNLNSLIQNLRNVTWLLQKQKSNLPDFQEWYGAWQDSVKADPAMGWVVKARNRIVKEADLEIHSEARVRISYDWTHEYEKTFRFPPRFTTRQILRTILTQNALRPEGTISIDRRWVDRMLPDWELLDATSRAYSRIAHVIGTAHSKAGVDTCNLPTREPSCVDSHTGTRAICMDPVDQNRALHVDLKSGYEIAEIRVPIGITTEEQVRGAVEKYGMDFDPGSGDAIARVPNLLKTAKMVLSVDESHHTFAYLLIDDRVVAQLPMQFPNQETKRLALQRLADEVRRESANGLILVGEQWVAFVHPDEDFNAPGFKPARDRPDREEAITVTAMTKDGRLLQAFSIFKDRGGKRTFDEDNFTDLGGAIPNFLLPVARVWEIGPFKSDA